MICCLQAEGICLCLACREWHACPVCASPQHGNWLCGGRDSPPHMAQQLHQAWYSWVETLSLRNANFIQRELEERLSDPGHGAFNAVQCWQAIGYRELHRELRRRKLDLDSTAAALTTLECHTHPMLSLELLQVFYVAAQGQPFVQNLVLDMQRSLTELLQVLEQYSRLRQVLSLIHI